MKILSFRLNKISISYFLLSSICFLLIVLILQNGEYKEVSNNSFNNQVVIDFLLENGVTPDVSTEQISEIILPANFNKVLNEYNKIQNKQGFDLSNFAGKSVTKYEYKLLNYENEVNDIFSTILVYNNSIIAADIHSVKMNGFIKGVIK